MGNVNMEASQINYRGGEKKMSVEVALKNTSGEAAAIAGEIDSLKSGLTDLSEEVNGDATVYPYADVITIEDAVPANLADCSVKIEPVQSGSGDPSPTNVRPISGHTEVDVYKAAKNLAVTQRNNNVVCFCKTGQTYTVSANVAFNLYENSLSGKNLYRGSSPYTFTATKDFGLYFNGWNNPSFIQVELGDRKTSFEPYQGKTYTIALGDTIYGGTVDFDSGVMTVDRRFVEYTDGTGWQRASSDPGMWFFCYPTGSVAISADFVTDKFDVRLPQTGIFNTAWIQHAQLHIKPDTNIAPSGATAEGLEEFKTWLTNNHLQVVYPLAAPTTIQLTPQQIQLLKGQNTITASTGQISVTVNGVAGAIGSVQEKVNATDAVLADIAEQLPAAPTTDGAYVLTVTVADGNPAYSWESTT